MIWMSRWCWCAEYHELACSGPELLQSQGRQRLHWENVEHLHPGGLPPHPAAPILARAEAGTSALSLREQVTCGSTIKLEADTTRHLLHSHEVSYGYGRGSGQQSVTGFPERDSANSLWVVRSGGVSGPSPACLCWRKAWMGASELACLQVDAAPGCGRSPSGVLMPPAACSAYKEPPLQRARRSSCNTSAHAAGCTATSLCPPSQTTRR